MGEIDYTQEFPVSLKMKMPIIVSDSITPVISHSETVGLRKLDGSEQNEQHVVRAVNSSLKVPTPKISVVPKKEAIQPSCFFAAPPRCFIYDTDFMEPQEYICNTEDKQFVRLFNLTHKFIKVTIEQVHVVINAIELIVKDFMTENPQINQVLFLLDDKAPPYPVVKAIFDHWQQKPKINGSVIRMEEYPPDHCGSRTSHLKSVQQKNKMRKSMNDMTYLRRLRSELNDIRQRRAEAAELFDRQCEKRKENIIFLRKTIRAIRNKSPSTASIAMMLEPELNEVKELEPEPKELTHSPLPGPPTIPAFLEWCQDQK